MKWHLFSTQYGLSLIMAAALSLPAAAQSSTNSAAINPNTIAGNWRGTVGLNNTHETFTMEIRQEEGDCMALLDFTGQEELSGHYQLKFCGGNGLHLEKNHLGIRYDFAGSFVREVISGKLRIMEKGRVLRLVSFHISKRNLPAPTRGLKTIATAL